MAKELPFFKFEPNEWSEGNIQICSKLSKGLFIDICATYWSRKGELSYALALQKHCNGNTNELQELIDNEILIIKDNQIIIEFLDEQLNKFARTSNIRRKAANKRWNAKAMQKQCKSNAIREDNIREEKDNIYNDFDNFWNQYHEITNLQKTDKEPTLKYWNKLSKSNKQKAIDNIKNYYNSLNDKKYCKKARTYLRDKNFNDDFKSETKVLRMPG